MGQMYWRQCVTGTCAAILAFGIFGVSQEAASVGHPSKSEKKRPELADRFSSPNWGDQGDGTYANPILPGDFSDIDVIRVGRNYYMISSTMQYSPGVIILHSKDLVNWKIIGHVVKDLTSIDPELSWNRMNRAGQGIWAGGLRYHAGKFWVYFGTPNQGIYVSTSINPAGPWTPVQLVLSAAGWDDPCPFWDDDGQGYLVATHFQAEGKQKTQYNIHLFKMAPDGTHLLPASDVVIHQSRGSEANKLYKINGFYYHYYSEVAREGRVIMMERSRNLHGPWEIHQLIHVNAAVDKEPNQGGLVELPSGKWYFVSHQGRGDWEGRAGVLLPVTWVDGWPIIGRVGSDGIGNMIWRGKKPIAGFARTVVSTSDDFNSPKLKPEWEWNYQPDVTKWSLTERPGFLRLHAFPPISVGDFQTVGNVLTQRSLRTRKAEVTVSLDLAGMRTGQEAGIAHFARTYATFGIVQNDNSRRIIWNHNGAKCLGPVVAKSRVWLRSTWGFDGISQFSFSTDGHNFQPFGEPYQLTWGHYRGDRIGIFTFNPAGSAGYTDIDKLQYKVER
ncbi:MAG: glycoside hydrolase 43 family protein [Edaphobacter sp.]|jgi:beta-xylosidase